MQSKGNKKIIRYPERRSVSIKHPEVKNLER